MMLHCLALSGCAVSSFRRLLFRMASASAGRPPELGRETVASIARDLFPFREVREESVKQLPSYDDRNFYFRGSPECGDGMNEYILKVSNTCFSFEVNQGMNCIMRFLKSREFDCPYPLLSRRGVDVEYVPEMDLIEKDGDCEKRKFSVRVVSFIPGEVLDNIDQIHITPRLLYDVGKYIGGIDAALQDFSHTAIDSRVLLNWDIKHFLALRKHLSVLDDPKKRNMAETIFQGFEDNVVPYISSMKQGTIYGDANGMNIVVKKLNGTYSLAGIIDFGDVVHTCCLFELGIMLGYAMLEKANPIQLVCPMLCGYLKAFPLSEMELDCLYYVVLARLCQSAVNGEYHFKQEPWNTYLLLTPVHAWKVIEEMLEISKCEVDRIWAEARSKNAEDF